MVLPQEPAILSPEQVLTAYATIRGFMATGGRPDQVRARLIRIDMGIVIDGHRYSRQ
jgi:hypothetical protein